MAIELAAAKTLRDILLGTGAGVTDDFFRSLCEHLCKALDVRFAMLGQFPRGEDPPQRIETLAVFAEGMPGEKFEFEIADTPCAEVAANGACQFTGNLGEQFPHCNLLKNTEARWFMGVPVRDGSGNVAGTLCLMHTRDPDDARGVQAVLEIFAARAGAEIERAKAEQALRDSEERSRAILDASVNATVTMGEDCIILSVNPATEKMFGYCAEELLGKNVSILMPSPYREKHDGFVSHYVQTGEKKIIGIGREAVAQRKNGSLFPIDLSVGEARLSGGRRLFTGIIRDISDRKDLEDKLLSISEEERRHIGREIHDDLCQRFFGIGCLIKVLQQKSSQASAEEREAMAELSRLVGEANARAREMAHGLMPVALESDGLMGALRDLAETTRKVCDVECGFHCASPVLIEDNRTAVQLYRIAQEAVTNSLRHGNPRRIEIELNTDGTNIILEVRDDGEGLPEPDRRRRGMGLLTMSHRARMLGGHCEIASHGGAVVTCAVPSSAVPADKDENHD